MNIHYDTIGSGPSLILLHGFPANGSTWDPVKDALAKHFKLWIPDLPGAGRSPLPAAPLSISLMAQSVAEMMDREQIEKAWVAGHSMGGYTALELAHQMPERIAGLSLIHSSAYADKEEKKENRRKAIRLIEKGRDGQEMFLRGSAPNMFADIFIEKRPEALNDFVQLGMELPGRHLAAFYEAMIGREDRTEVLREANFPLQWIIGDEDKVIPKSDILEQAMLSAAAHIACYPGCGHLSMQEMPERLQADLVYFGKYCFGV